jgi:uncharacterized protein YacL (UPF0231 family)
LRLKWIVYRHDINKKKIAEFNIFDHWRFEEDVKKDLKKCKTKEEFAKKIKSHLMYYFWSKCEYEVVISSFPVHIKKDEFNRLTEAFKKDTAKYGHEPYGMWVRPDVGYKIDIYNQVMLNFDVFVDYVWSHKRSKSN